jgi:hypothetical protein
VKRKRYSRKFQAPSLALCCRKATIEAFTGLEAGKAAKTPTMSCVAGGNMAR